MEEKGNNQLVVQLDSTDHAHNQQQQQQAMANKKQEFICGHCNSPIHWISFIIRPPTGMTK